MSFYPEGKPLPGSELEMEWCQGGPDHLAEHGSQKEFPVSLVSMGTEFLRLVHHVELGSAVPPHTLKSPA